MISKRLLAGVTLIVAVVAGGGAFAHDDPNPETAAQRCDTWWRPDHQSGSPPSSHHHTAPGSDISVGDPVNSTAIHQHGGHYVVRGKYGYIEVVGGQGYTRPFGDPTGARGGWVQGELDVAPGAPDVDFNAGAFAGTDPGPHLGYSEANACMSVANTVVQQWQCKKPPQPGGSCN